MEFKFNINEIFQAPIVEVNQSLIPPGFAGDRRGLSNAIGKVAEVINAMGDASAAAQGLTNSITTAERLRKTDQTIYLLVDKDAKSGKGVVTGMLKTGKKSLYVFDRDGQHHHISPPCVLDFYVHESRQRMGLGKQLFEHMLKKECVEPVKLAIDRPSDKLLSFMGKHYGLESPMRQMNNYVVFDGFFPESSVQNINGSNDETVTFLHKEPANGLQTISAPLGRYGAPRPPCSMGQIIHNQSSIQSNETTGTNSYSQPQTTNVTQSCPQLSTEDRPPSNINQGYPSTNVQSVPNVWYQQAQNQPQMQVDPNNNHSMQYYQQQNFQQPYSSVPPPSQQIFPGQQTEQQVYNLTQSQAYTSLPSQTYKPPQVPSQNTMYNPPNAQQYTSPPVTLYNSPSSQFYPPPQTQAYSPTQVYTTQQPPAPYSSSQPQRPYLGNTSAPGVTQNQYSPNFSNLPAQATPSNQFSNQPNQISQDPLIPAQTQPPYTPNQSQYYSQGFIPNQPHLPIPENLLPPPTTAHYMQQQIPNTPLPLHAPPPPSQVPQPPATPCPQMLSTQVTASPTTQHMAIPSTTHTPLSPPTTPGPPYQTQYPSVAHSSPQFASNDAAPYTQTASETWITNGYPSQHPPQPRSAFVTTNPQMPYKYYDSTSQQMQCDYLIPQSTAAGDMPSPMKNDQHATTIKHSANGISSTNLGQSGDYEQQQQVNVTRTQDQSGQMFGQNARQSQLQGRPQIASQ